MKLITKSNICVWSNRSALDSKRRLNVLFIETLELLDHDAPAIVSKPQEFSARKKRERDLMKLQKETREWRSHVRRYKVACEYSRSVHNNSHAPNKTVGKSKKTRKHKQTARLFVDIYFHCAFLKDHHLTSARARQISRSIEGFESIARKSPRLSRRNQQNCSSQTNLRNQSNLSSRVPQSTHPLEDPHAEDI